MKSLEDILFKHYSKADTATLLNGLTWYEKAHNEAKLLADVFEVPLTVTVGVISALSPRNKWARNLADAWSILDEPSLETKTCTFKGQRQKAIDIINSSGDRDEILKILGKGTKTRNFFTNILDFNTSTCVTVDVWAFRSVNLEPKNKNYKPVENAYKSVATQIGILPHQLQAIIWGTVRGSLV